ncbi:MAG: alpha/beta hydrolase fold domain-containing protein [Lachnospiraceae bacterium]|nr:alpha/beta hydrolase fold domain-containing protein [Lachnospiraceae bacterium]
MSSHKSRVKIVGAVVVVVLIFAAAVGIYQSSKANEKTKSGSEKQAGTETEAEKQKADGCVIFLHSGGFVIEKNVYHEQFGAALGEVLGYDYLVPDYPINQTYEETLSYMEQIYKETMKEYDKVLLIGCSAGANLAVSSIMELGETYGMPNGLILMSPWLDTSMENEEITCVSEFDQEFFDSLVEWGSQYNGGDTENILASPVKASKKQLENFPKTVMVVGDQDILRFDAEKFYDNLTEAGVEVTYLTAEGKNHGEVFAEYASTYVMPKIMNEALGIVKE